MESIKGIMFAATILVVSAGTTRADVVGLARVIDGDTIVIAGERIRLHGIDAPEMKQTCKTRKGKEQLCGHTGWPSG